MRNPFLFRSSERIIHDDNFVELFGAKAIKLLSELDNPWDGISIIRSAPGGGKSTLFRLLTPRSLKLVCKYTHNANVQKTFRLLRQVGAVNENGPDIFGVMIGFSSEYRYLPTENHTNGPFKALLNARIVISSIRSALDWFGKSYPENLADIHFSWQPESGSTIPSSADGLDLFNWASKIEDKFFAQLDSLDTDNANYCKHLRLDGLKWFSNAKIFSKDTELTAKRTLLLDEIHSLSSVQRERLLTIIIESRENCGVWIAERTEALTDYEFLKNGALRNRDYQAIINLEEWRSRPKSSKSFEIFLNDVADIRVSKASGFEGHYFRSFIDDNLEYSLWERKLTQKIDEVKQSIRLNAEAKLYSNWVEYLDEERSSTLEKAIRWKTVDILSQQDQKKKQQDLCLPFTVEQFKERESGARILAQHFLLTEIEAPVYFGFKTLAGVSSSNVEQFLAITSEVFERIASKVAHDNDFSYTLNSEIQDKLIRKFAKQRWEDLIYRLPKSSYGLNFLKNIGEFCKRKTFQPNTPYANGVSGVAITVADRDKLVDYQSKNGKPNLAVIRETLATLVVNNLLMPIPVRQDGKHYIVYYLNRLICVHFGLPLSYGGWQRKKLSEMHGLIQAIDDDKEQDI